MAENGVVALRPAVKPRSVHLLLAFLASAGALLVYPAATHATSVPDSTRITLLRTALTGFDDFRVVTDSTKLFGHHATVSPGGVQVHDIPDRKWVSLQTPAEERVVPWAEVESIHARKGAGAGGVVMGTVVGLIVGGMIALAAYPDALDPLRGHSTSTEDSGGAAIVVGCLVGGAAIGAWIDHPWPGPWHTVYP